VENAALQGLTTFASVVFLIIGGALLGAGVSRMAPARRRLGGLNPYLLAALLGAGVPQLLFWPFLVVFSVKEAWTEKSEFSPTMAFVAAQDIPEGAVLTPEMSRLASVPRRLSTAVFPEADKEKITQARALVPIAADELILPSRLSSAASVESCAWAKEPVEPPPAPVEDSGITTPPDTPTETVLPGALQFRE
jgi:hypothetical protein